MRPWGGGVFAARRAGAGKRSDLACSTGQRSGQAGGETGKAGHCLTNGGAARRLVTVRWISIVHRLSVETGKDGIAGRRIGNGGTAWVVVAGKRTSIVRCLSGEAGKDGLAGRRIANGGAARVLVTGKRTKASLSLGSDVDATGEAIGEATGAAIGRRHRDASARVRNSCEISSGWCLSRDRAGCRGSGHEGARG